MRADCNRYLRSRHPDYSLFPCRVALSKENFSASLKRIALRVALVPPMGLEVTGLGKLGGRGGVVTQVREASASPSPHP